MNGRWWLTLPAGLLLAAGCQLNAPVQPIAKTATLRTGPAPAAAVPNPGRPGYEQAYVNGNTVTINAIEIPNVAPEQAQADFYEVVYPKGWENLGIGTPQCNPCDHDHNGVDPEDYHDHILDSQPSNPGGNDYRGPWHVYVVVPAYNGNAEHDSQLTTAYAGHIPTMSEDAVNDLLASKLADGSPVAVKIDTHFYFLCAVVSPNAAR